MDRRTLTSAEPASPLACPERSLGDRLRRLRNERGLTQTELAEARVTKEYISQIETGKTRPTQQTVEWLAERLGVDPLFLEDGVSDREYHGQAEVVAQAEDAVAEKRYRDAVGLISGLPKELVAPDLRLRALFAASWSQMYLGELRTAIDRLERAREVAADSMFGDVDRAEVLYRLGCCRYKLTHVEKALEHFSAALELLPPSPRLGGGERGHRARARARRVAERRRDDRPRPLPGVARRRADRPMAPRTSPRGACKGALRGRRRPAQRQPAAEQPRRPDVHARSSGGGGRAAQGRLPDRARGRRADRRRPCRLVARAGSSAFRRPRARRAAGAPRARAPRRARRLPRRDRQRAARPRPGVSGAGTSRRGGGDVRGGGAEPRAALVRKPPRRRLDGPGRPRARARRRPRCRCALPLCRRSSSGDQGLGGRR